LLAQPFDADTLQLGGDAFPVAGRVGTMLGSTMSYHRWNFSASGNGVLVFDPQPNRQRSHVLWVESSGKTVNSLVGLDDVRMLSLAPDDRRFLVDRTSRKTP
jgi:hypothetical protein